MIRLQALEPSEFDEYKHYLVEDYAMEIMLNFDVPLDEARITSATEIDAMLHDERPTKRQNVYKIVRADDAQGSRIGNLWLEVNTSRGRCVVQDIYLEGGFRGQGLGRQTLDLVDNLMREQGIQRIRLHVAANNAAARALYEKQGYEVVRLTMQKVLGR
ncbi:MAG: GNAT family N-acetyltransferase [Anaerolineales bacterium]|nr:GNAT family N-acetyltransferase [Anaerolineales bacterium]